MKLVSKFENFYILRLLIIPVLFAGLSILLVTSKPNVALFFLVLAFLVLTYNLATIFQIIVEEKEIIKISFLTRKKKVIPYSVIKSSRLDFTRGVETDAGIINPGYYRCIFILENNEELIISPLHFENYNELIRVIGQNRNELDWNNDFL